MMRDKDGNIIPLLAVQMALFFPCFALGWIIGTMWGGIQCGMAAGKEPPK